MQTADPETRRPRGALKVDADIKVNAPRRRTATLHATTKYPFWDESTHSWVAAAELSPGRYFVTAADTVAAAPSRKGAAIRDNLTVD